MPGGQVLRYLLAGGTAAAANYGSRFLFSLWLPFEVAVVLAYGVGMAVGFVLMRRYAFAPSSLPLSQQMARYAAVNVLAVLQTVVISSLLARWLLPALGVPQGPAQAVAHAVGVVVPVVTSWIGHRRWTFR